MRQGRERTESVAAKGQAVFEAGLLADLTKQFLAASLPGDERRRYAEGRVDVAPDAAVDSLEEITPGDEFENRVEAEWYRAWQKGAQGDKDSPYGRRELGPKADEALGLPRLAALPGGDLAEAVATATSAGEVSYEVHWALFRATGDRTHLAEAKRLLDKALAPATAEHRAAILANVRLNREIVEACKAAGIS